MNPDSVTLRWAVFQDSNASGTGPSQRLLAQERLASADFRQLVDARRSEEKPKKRWAVQ